MMNKLLTVIAIVLLSVCPAYADSEVINGDPTMPAPSELQDAVDASHTQHTDTGTTGLTFTVDSDATGTEPANGAGWKIEGGSGDITLIYDTTDNEMDLSAPLSVTGNVKTSGNITDGTNASSPANLKDAVDKKHTQGTDQGLDTGGANAVTAAQTKAAYDNLSGYETIYIPAAAFSPTATNGAAIGTYEYATNDRQETYLAFNGATEQFACISFTMPEDWDLGTVKFKFKWTSATGSTAGDTIEFEIAGRAVADGDAIDQAYGTAQVISDTLLADNGGDWQTTGPTPAVTFAGTPAKGCTVALKISRNVSGTDDMTELGWLMEVGMQYKKTSTAPTLWE